MTISKDFLYYYGDCFRLFLQIGWQNYFNIMIFLLKYTYILICMRRNVRFKNFDLCLGSGYMCKAHEYIYYLFQTVIVILSSGYCEHIFCRVGSNFWFTVEFSTFQPMVQKPKLKSTCKICNCNSDSLACNLHLNSK